MKELKKNGERRDRLGLLVEARRRAINVHVESRTKESDWRQKGGNTKGRMPVF
eukprot:COSAG02_NODE_4433_length_5362_cov_8.984800_3_plen_53_part_00